jgi:hypothetical protein
MSPIILTLQQALDGIKSGQYAVGTWFRIGENVQTYVPMGSHFVRLWCPIESICYRAYPVDAESDDECTICTNEEIAMLQLASTLVLSV